MKGSRKYINGLKFLSLLAISHVPSHTIRNFFYRFFGLKLGKGSAIYGKCELRHPNNVRIGNNSIIGHNAILDGRGGITIGNNVNISSGVWIWTAEHNVQDPLFRTDYGMVIIEDYAWLSCRSTILPNTRIGKGAVVCAGAVVTKDIPEYSIVGGVPAKIIGERNRDLKYNLGEPIAFI
jgi:acetyltransferase-like isoleucine patch superfamily enzyme